MSVHSDFLPRQPPLPRFPPPQATMRNARTNDPQPLAASTFFSSFTTPAFQAWVQEMRTQAAQSTRNLTPKDYIRLLAIVGGYCLLRPYLVRLGGRFQASDHEREIDDDTEILSGGRDKGIISPNLLRGQIPEDSEEEEEEEGDKGVVSWGRKARRRQRGLVRKIVEAEEKRRREEEEADSDKEIEEFLRGAID